MTELYALWQSNHSWLETGIATLIASAALIAAYGYSKRASRMAKTAASTINTAAQAYVELAGSARAMPNTILTAPLSGKACAWYRYKVEHQEGRGINRQKTTLRQGESNDIFFIQDGSGRCAINPLGAKITASKKISWKGKTALPDKTPDHSSISFQFNREEPYTYTEERIHVGDIVYAIGQFKTRGATNEKKDNRLTHQYTLTVIKQNPLSPLAPFNVQGKARALMQEWHAAIQSAERAAAKQAQQPKFHTIGPSGKKHQPLILSSSPQRLKIIRYRVYTWLLLSIFILAGLVAIQLFNGQTIEELSFRESGKALIDIF